MVLAALKSYLKVKGCLRPLDLAASEIMIKESDITKKSHTDAYLCSYKISVPATDLQKALDPSIWPIRVKVREFIHYASKNSRLQKGDRRAGYQPASSAGHATGVSADPGGGQAHHGGDKPKTHLQVPTI